MYVPVILPGQTLSTEDKWVIYQARLRSKWLDTGQVHFLHVYGRDGVKAINMRKTKRTIGLAYCQLPIDLINFNGPDS